MAAPGFSWAAVPLGSSGEMVAESSVAQARTTIFYIGRYISRQLEPGTFTWVPEEPGVKWIDLRSRSAMAVKPELGAVSCCLFAIAPGPVSSPNWLQLSTTTDGALGVSLALTESKLGIDLGTLKSATLGELAFELLVTNNSSPLLPNRNGVWTLSLDGVRLFNEPLERHPAEWSKIILDADYPGPPLDAQPVRFAQSAQAESWDCADGALSCDLTWTVHSGNAFILSNTAGADAANTVASVPGMSSDNHTVQWDAAFIESSGASSYPGALCRVNSSGDTFYMFRWVRGTSTYDLIRVVSGSQTVIDTGAGTLSVSDTLKISCDGSSISGLVNDVEETAATDTGVTSGSRVGFRMNRVGSGGTRLDNFYAVELGTNPRRVIIVN